MGSVLGKTPMARGALKQACVIEMVLEGMGES